MDIGNIINVGMNIIKSNPDCPIMFSSRDDYIELIALNQINEPLLKYNNTVGILGYIDTILICGNHQLNNSLIVYSYNFTSQEQQFIFSYPMIVTHVIQPQYTLTPQYCVFFSDKSNSSIIYNIYEKEVIFKSDNLNLNITERLYPTSERTIYHFIHNDMIRLFPTNEKTNLY